jgi:hypothetical protein
VKKIIEKKESCLRSLDMVSTGLVIGRELCPAYNGSASQGRLDASSFCLLYMRIYPAEVAIILIFS